MKIFFLAICRFLIIFCLFKSIAFARTDYVVLERRADINIFEKYIDHLISMKAPIASIKQLSVEDKVWIDLSKKYYNTINNIHYSSDDYLIMQNKKYEFEIHFSHRYTGNLIIWTCKIVDDSRFFHPRECNGWEKIMINQD